MIRFCVLAAAVAAMTGRAVAQPLDDPKIKKADQLFEEGKQLQDSNLEQACAKFEQSLQLNGEAIGTLINVALCDEKLGHVASAVTKFTETRDRAKEQGLPEYLRAAEQHLAALEPLVPHLTIKLAEDLPGTSVLVDSAVIAPAGLASIAVDPGERVIEVNAPDRLPYRTKVIIAKSAHQDVVVPALARSVVVRSSRPKIGEIMVIAGGAAMATGLGLGLYARSQYNDQFDGKTPNCQTVNGHKLCNPEGFKNTDHARTLGTVGTIVGVAGIGVAVGGAILWLMSPHSTAPADERRPSVSIAPSLSPDGVGLTALGRF